jgi:type IX secretion system PorP/SprF family membrane protein
MSALLRTLFFISLFSITIGAGLQAQDFFYTQVYTNRLYYNPAFAGSTPCPQLKISYRDQWPQVQNAYQTMGAAYQQQADLLHGGLGLLVSNDRQANGALNSFHFSGIYAYHVHIDHYTTMNLAIQAGATNRSANWGQLTYADMLSPGAGTTGSTSENLPAQASATHEDLSAGAILFKPRWWGGISAHHLSGPPLSGIESKRAPLKLTLLGGYRHDIVHGRIKRGDLSLMPSLLYQYQNNMQQVFYGLHVKYLSISTGLWLRHNPVFQFDCIATMLGLSYKNITFAYSYDYSVSGIGHAGIGAHEIGLSIDFICLDRKKRWKRAIKCPEI